MITLPLLICLIGLLLWLLFARTTRSDPWVAELGRIMFAIGLLWTLAPYAGKALF